MSPQSADTASELRRPVPLMYHAESDRVWYVRSQHVFAIEMIAVARAMELLDKQTDVGSVELTSELDEIETTIEVPHFFGTVTAVAHFADIMAAFAGCVPLNDLPKRAKIGRRSKVNALLARWLRFCDDIATGIASGAELDELLATVWAKEPPEPGFYAVGDDTFLVTHAGEVLEVVRGGMDGPIVTRVTALPTGVGCELMDGAAWLPSVVLQAARIVGVPSPLLDLADDAVGVLDEVLFGGGPGPGTPDMDVLRRDGLVAVEGDRLQLTSRCRRLLAELCTILTRGSLLPLVDEEAVG